MQPSLRRLAATGSDGAHPAILIRMASSRDALGDALGGGRGLRGKGRRLLALVASGDDNRLTLGRRKNCVRKNPFWSDGQVPFLKGIRD